MNKHILWKSFFLITVASFMILHATCSFAYTDLHPKLPDAWKDFFDQYRMWIGFVTGIGTLTSVVVFIIHMIQLATISSHPIKRRHAINNILISLICTMLLGALTTLNLLFYNIIFN